MAIGKFVSYLRVSTGKQGRSGLGLEAQRSSITQYLNGGSYDLLNEFVEVESGKDSNRPKLNDALRLCQLTGATLIIAKLDRLSRDPDFMGVLMKAGTEFVACDMPEANKFMVRIMAALAEKERELISERTIAALKAAKVRGVQLGQARNATPAGRTKGYLKSLEVRQAKSAKFMADVAPIIAQQREQGESLRTIAAGLNSQGIVTAQGVAGKWSAMKVKAVLDRLSAA